jgi:branched-chain amino acid aminotransferase
VDIKTSIEYKFTDEPGKISSQLYNKLRAIQYGDEPDRHNWITFVE